MNLRPYPTSSLFCRWDRPKERGGDWLKLMVVQSVSWFLDTLFAHLTTHVHMRGGLSGPHLPRVDPVAKSLGAIKCGTWTLCYSDYWPHSIRHWMDFTAFILLCWVKKAIRNKLLQLCCKCNHSNRWHSLILFFERDVLWPTFPVKLFLKDLVNM